MERQYLTLPEIKTKIKSYAVMINLGSQRLPTIGFSLFEEGAFVDVDSSGYHYGDVERGVERDRITTEDIDELLYYVFSYITSSLGMWYELQHRVDRQDSRRISFAYQIGLMAILKASWAEREQRYHLAILEFAPFDDLASERANLCGELRRKGLSEPEIDKISYKQYPLPPGEEPGRLPRKVPK